MISIKPLTEENIKNLKIRDKNREYFLTCNLLGQIRTWMFKNGYPIENANTLLINKLLYFIVQEIHKDNPDIWVSSGWYRYGPCLEEYRKRGEEGTTDLTLTQPFSGKKILEKVKKVCEEEVPLFFKFRDKDKYKRYCYHYLKHIYEDKCEYPQLDEYYRSKNELAYAFLQFAFNKEKVPDLKKHFLNFQRAIINKKYTHFVKINEMTQEKIFNYLTVMKKLILLNIKPKESTEYWFVLRKVASDFEKNILGEFSYKNYIATYKDVNSRIESKRKKWFEKEVAKYEDVISRHIISNVEWVDTLIKEGGVTNE